MCCDGIGNDGMGCAALSVHTLAISMVGRASTTSLEAGGGPCYNRKGQDRTGQNRTATERRHDGDNRKILMHNYKLILYYLISSS